MNVGSDTQTPLAKENFKKDVKTLEVSKHGFQIKSANVTETGFLKLKKCPLKYAKLSKDPITKNSKIVKLSKPLPRITIPYIPSDISPTNLRSIILSQNLNLSSLTEVGETFGISFSTKVTDGKYNAFFKCSPNIRVEVFSCIDKIYVHASRVKIFSRWFVKRCVKCCGFHHNSIACSKTSFSCKHCASDHDSKDCPDKNRSVCINCSKFMIPDHKFRANDHQATNRECPCHKDTFY